jgi:hypothetical protein
MDKAGMSSRRRTAKSAGWGEAEGGEEGAGAPLNAFGNRPEREAGGVEQPEDRKSRIGQRGERLGQPGPPGVVTILVPPAVLDEVETVLHLPVTPDVSLELTRRDRLRSQAGDKVPALAREKFPLGRSHLAIHAQRDPAAGNVQMLPDVIGVVQAQPEPAGVLIQPLFSTASQAGRTGESWKKQASNASRMSGWFSLTWNR